MSDTSRLSPATIAAQAAGAIDVQTGGVVPALPMATTYLRDAAYQPLRPDNIYLRDQSDIVRVAENVLAQLEGAKETLLFPSGMAALAAAFRTVPNGGRVLVQNGYATSAPAVTLKYARSKPQILLHLHRLARASSQHSH